MMQTAGPFLSSPDRTGVVRVTTAITPLYCVQSVQQSLYTAQYTAMYSHIQSFFVMGNYDLEAEGMIMME